MTWDIIDREAPGYDDHGGDNDDCGSTPVNTRPFWIIRVSYHVVDKW